MKYYFVFGHEPNELNNQKLWSIIKPHVKDEAIEWRNMFFVYSIDMSQTALTIRLQQNIIPKDVDQDNHLEITSLKDNQRIDIIFLLEKIVFCQEGKEDVALRPTFLSAKFFNEDQYQEWQYERLKEFDIFQILLKNPNNDYKENTIYLYNDEPSQTLYFSVQEWKTDYIGIERLNKHCLSFECENSSVTNQIQQAITNGDKQITDVMLKGQILSFIQSKSIKPTYKEKDSSYGWWLSIPDFIPTLGYAISKRRSKDLPERSWLVIATKERFVRAEEKQETFIYDNEAAEDKQFLTQWQASRLKIKSNATDKKNYYQQCVEKLKEMENICDDKNNWERLYEIYIFLDRYFNNSARMDDKTVLDNMDSKITVLDYYQYQWMCTKGITWIGYRGNNNERIDTTASLSGCNVITLWSLTTERSGDVYLGIQYFRSTIYPCGNPQAPCLYLFNFHSSQKAYPFKIQYGLASNVEVAELLKNTEWVQKVQQTYGFTPTPMLTDIITDELPPMEPACVLPAKNVLQALDHEKKQKEVLEKIETALGDSYKDRLTMTQVCDENTHILHYNVSIDPLAASEPEKTGSAEIEEVDNVSQSKSIMEIHNDKIVVPNGWQLGFPDQCKFNDNKVAQEAQRLIAMAKAALDTYIATKELTAQDFFKQGKKKQMIKTSGSNKEMQAIIEALLTVDTKNIQHKPVLSEKYTITEDLRTAINKLLEGNNICQIDEKQTIKRLYSDCLMFKQKKELSNDVAGIKNTLTKLPV